MLHIANADGVTTRFVADAFGNVTTNFTQRTANGTATSPTAVQLNMGLGVNAFYGYGATGYSASARAAFSAFAAENWTDTAQGTYFTVSTTPVGSTTLTEAMRISSAGILTLPVAPLPIGSGGTGTASTLTGLVRGSASAMSAAELSADVTTSGSNAVTLAAKFKVRTCVVVTGDPGSASPVLADDNDSPVACGNSYGADWTITSVACWANGGSPTVTPILTGGGATTVLTGALTCGTGSWAAGTLNGTPVVHTFSADGATCASTPCTMDVNITTAGGTAKYLVVRITGTL
jgi:hypothetical protein